MTDRVFIISLILAATPLIALGLGFWNRHKLGKGIGVLFIRYTVRASSAPLIALLAINDSLSTEAAVLMGAALGFALFGKDNETS